MTLLPTPYPDNRPPRLPMYERASADRLPSLQLRARDLEILRATYEYRVLTPRLYELLFWPAPDLLDHPVGADRPPAKKVNTRAHARLQRLFHHGYLARHEQATTRRQPKPFVYMLDRRGADLLSANAGAPVDWRPPYNQVSLGFLDHRLLTNAFRVCLTVATRGRGVELVEWVDDDDLKAEQKTNYVTLDGPDGGQPKRVPVLPDGYFLLQTAEHQFRFFVEIDRGTIVGQSSRWAHRDMATRVRAYNRFVESGRFSERFGGQGMRVLTVTTGESRMRNLMHITREAGGRNRWWFSTFDQITPASVLGEVWTTAGKPGLHSLVW